MLKMDQMAVLLWALVEFLVSESLVMKLAELEHAIMSMFSAG